MHASPKDHQNQNLKTKKTNKVVYKNYCKLENHELVDWTAPYLSPLKEIK